MTTRVFRARSLIDAREAAIAALGREAVILTTREVKRSGLLGLLGGTEIEVAAATPPTVIEGPASSRAPFATDAYGAKEPPADDALRTRVVNALRADLRSEIRSVKLAIGAPPGRSDASVESLTAEVCAIREAVEQLSPSSTRSGKLASMLRLRGLEGRAAAEICRALKGPSSEALDARLRTQLASMLQGGEWPLPASGRRAVVAAVGLSGVGKTTTLAKLAVHAKKRGLSVSFVTCDTFRVGAVEQLKRYASLLDAPFEVARTRAELEAHIVASLADLVIVDTSGRPPVGDAVETLLGREAFAGSRCASLSRNVLFCTTGAARDVDVQRAVKVYAPTSPSALAITKMDETSQPSGVLHAAWATRLPIALTCSGPRVPEDLELPDIPAIVGHILPSSQSTRARAA